MPKKQVYHRWSPTLGGGFAGTPEEVWGTLPYDPDRHINEDVVYCGLYGLPDFYSLWRHKGKKYIWWCGSDITHFVNGYWLDTSGSIRLDPRVMAKWISKNCDSWVENEVESKALGELGIKTQRCPSFLGNIDDYEVSFKPGNKVYTSVSGDDFKLYGWHLIPELALRNPDIEFHLYGNNKEWISPNTWNSRNIVVHGRVSQEQMNKEIKEMQGALRLTEFDGCSELIVKAMLWGQYAFSLIEYPFIDKIDKIKLLPTWLPNMIGRNWWIKNLNKYPWNQKLQ